MHLPENRILIVEDNQNDLFIIKEYLKRTSFYRYSIDHAGSLTAALVLLQQQEYKLVLIDLFLPDSEGIETFSRLFPSSKDAPVIILSGLINEKVALEALKNGAQDYLVKGEYDEKLLEKTIRYAMERKRNQVMLEESKAKYELLFESNPLPMFATDKQSLRILTVNEAALQYYGYTREEFCALTVKDLHADEDWPRLTVFKKANGFHHAGEWQQRKRDGGTMHVEIVTHSIVLGGVQARLFVVYDLTQRKKAEEHLKLLESAITNTNDAVLITEAGPMQGAGPKIVYINRAFTRMTGFAADEVIGKTPRILKGPKTDTRQVTELCRSLVNGQSVDGEIINYRKNGEEFWNSFTVVPVANSRGVYTHWISIQRDSTARRRLEEINRKRLEREVEERTRELKEALEKEKELAELKSRFISIASHEFRTPLASIGLAAETIRTYYDQLTLEDIQKKLNKILEQAGHMTHLLEDVLTLGKSEAGKIKLKLVDLDLNEFVLSLMEEVSAASRDHRKFELAYTVDRTLVAIDDKLLRNILVNLLTNAVKFSAPDTPVKLTIRDTETHLHIDVQDQGIGISEKDLSLIFEPFQRGSNSSAISGTGLGLSIVKKAVELMEGSIDVQSELSKGSVFRVKLPMKP